MCKCIKQCLLKNISADNSWEICQRCAKILLAAEHKMQLAYYLRNTEWFPEVLGIWFLQRAIYNFGQFFIDISKGLI